MWKCKYAHNKLAENSVWPCPAWRVGALWQGGIFLGKEIHVNVSVVMMVMLPDRRFLLIYFYSGCH